ncbi:MAG: hypothetical protein KC619_18545 [Myxococcales bacterium]|nr:hypothetical protein [Myxococcales bacterium]
MTDAPEPPDPELEAFYEAERARPSVGAAERHAALARVLTTAGHAPPPTWRIGAMTGGAGLAVGLALGVLIGLRLAPEAPLPEAPSVPPVVEPAEAAPGPSEAPVEPPDPRDEPSETVVAEPNEPSEPAETDAPREPTETDAPEPRERSREASLDAEMALLSRAQTALQRGLGQSALDALAEHRRRFPRGQLTEEREALVVQALARAGRDDEAAEAARRFEARYPSSLLRPVVRQAVGAR